MATHSRAGIGLNLQTVALVLGAGLFAGAVLIASFYATRFAIGLTLATVLVLIGFALAGNNRLACVYGIVGLAPLSLGKHFVAIPHMGGAASFSIDLIDPLILILVGYLLRDRAMGRPLYITPMAKWVAGLMALGMLNMLIGPYRILAAQEVVRMAKCYLLFFVIVNEVVRERQIMHVLIAMMGALFLQSAMGIVQGVFKISLGLQALGEADFETIEMTAKATYLGAGSATAGFRSNALLGHPNLLAAFLAMQLPICIALMFSRLSPFVRALIAVVTVMGGAALVMTLSRSGWLSFGTAIALLFALSFVHPRLQRRFLFTRVAAIGFMVAVVAAFSGAIIRRITQSDPGAVIFRIEWNQAAWGMVWERPLFGYGLNSFIQHLPGRTKYGGPIGLTDALGAQWPVVHNIYLLTWSEQGTLGFICFVGLHACILAAAIRNIRRYYSDVLFAVNLGCLCGVVALTVDGLASFYLRSPSPARVFWIIAAIIFVVDHWNRNYAARAAAIGAGREWPAGPAAPAPTRRNE